MDTKINCWTAVTTFYCVYKSIAHITHQMVELSQRGPVRTLFLKPGETKELRILCCQYVLTRSKISFGNSQHYGRHTSEKPFKSQFTFLKICATKLHIHCAKSCTCLQSLILRFAAIGEAQGGD